MKNQAADLVRLIIGIGLVAVTIAVTPWFSVDPINPIKMMFAAGAALASLGIVIANRQSLITKQHRPVIVATVAFVAWMWAVVLFAQGEFHQQLFGMYGRNTGFVTYVSFALVFFAISLISGPENNAKMYRYFLIAGAASLVYGFMQSIGLEPIKWVNGYSPVIGFLGNPNFQSSFLGVIGSLIFAMAISGKTPIKVKAVYAVYLLVTLYVIGESNSQQGFLVFISGVAVVLGLYIFTKSKTLTFGYLVISFIGFVALIVGTQAKGPFSFLYKTSVTLRGDYWRAGWNMTVDNPVFGVGMDSYGDWYRLSRDLETVNRGDYDRTANAAHNVYLDISAGGGFPLVLIYLAIAVLVVIAVLRVIKREKEFNPLFAGFVGAWVAFQAQSIISINQIGLAIWGWALSGLIIGYEINTREKPVIEVKRQGPKIKNGRAVQSSALTGLALFVGLVVGIAAGSPSYLASVKYKTALETQSQEGITKGAYLWPLEQLRMVEVAGAFNDQKLEKEALQITLDAIDRFPNSFYVWRALFYMKAATPEQKQEALAQMKRLDPLNPTLKQLG
jgi:O-antigen ligase